MSLYPKISLYVVNHSDPQGIKLRVTVQESAESREYSDVYFLPKDKFGFKKEVLLSRLSNPFLKMAIEELQCKIFIKVQKSLKEPIQLSLTPNGELIFVSGDWQPETSPVNRFEPFKSIGSFILSTDQSLIIASNIAAQFVSLTGTKKLVIQQDISSKEIVLSGESGVNHGFIQTKEIHGFFDKEFQNFSTIDSSLLINFIAVGILVNHKCMKAKKLLKIKSANRDSATLSVFNKGLFVADQIYLKPRDFENTGHVLCRHGIFYLDHTLRNKSIIIGLELLRWELGSQFVNERGAIVFTKFMRNWSSQFDNRGEIGFDRFFSITKKIFFNRNRAILAGKEIHVTTFSEDVKNEGLVLAQNFCSMIAHDVLSIEKGAKVLSFGDLQMLSKTGKTIINGDIITKNNANLLAAGDLVERGTIVGDKVSSSSTGDILVSSSVSGSESLSLTSSKDIKIEKEGKLSSKSINIYGLNVHVKGTISGDAGIIKAIYAFISEKSSTVDVNKLTILAQIVKILGKIKTGESLTINVNDYIHVLFGGSLESLHSMGLTAQSRIRNEGDITAQDDLTIWARDIIQNLKLMHGRNVTVTSRCILDNLVGGLIIASLKLKLISKEVMDNHGTLSGQTVNIRAGALFRNLMSGKVTGGDIDILAELLSNAGVIKGNKIILNSLQWLQNMLTGKVDARQLLSVKTRDFMLNDGLLRGQNVTLEANIIEVTRDGEVLAKQTLELLSHWHLFNQGKFTSLGDLTLRVKFIIDNAISGKITAHESLKLIQAAIVKNAGIITSYKDAFIEAQLIIQNLKEGTITATEGLTLISHAMAENAGILEAEHLIAKTETLLSNIEGFMLAKKKLECMSQAAMVLNGYCQSQGDVVLKAPNMNLSQVSAKKNFVIDAEFLQLQGPVTGQNVVAKVESPLDLSKGFLQADDTLELHVNHLPQFPKLVPSSLRLCLNPNAQAPLYFKDDLTVLGNFHLIASHLPLYLNAVVSATKDIDFSVLSLDFIRGALVSLQNIHVQAQETINDPNQNAIVAEGAINLSAKQIHLQETYLKAKQGLTLKGTESIELIYCEMEIQGDTIIITPKLHQQKKPTPDEIQEMIAREQQRQKKKLKKKKRKVIIKSAAGMVVGFGVAAFIGPGLMAIIGKMGTSIAQGMVFGGINAAFNKQDILLGALEGGFFAGLGQTLNSVKYISAIPSKVLQEAVKGGVTSLTHSAIHGGDVAKNVITGALSGGLGQKFAAPSDLPSSTFQELAQETGKAIVRGAATSAISHVVHQGKGRDLATNLMAAGLSAGLGNVAASVGQHLGSRAFPSQASSPIHPRSRQLTASSGYAAGDEISQAPPRKRFKETQESKVQQERSVQKRNVQSTESQSKTPQTRSNSKLSSRFPSPNSPYSPHSSHTHSFVLGNSRRTSTFPMRGCQFPMSEDFQQFFTPGFRAKGLSKSPMPKHNISIVDSCDFHEQIPGHKLSREESAYRSRMVQESFIKGAINLLDLPYDLNPFKGAIEEQNQRFIQMGLDPLPVIQHERPSVRMNRFLKNQGIDLNQAPPRNKVEDGISFATGVAAQSVAMGSLTKATNLGSQAIGRGSQVVGNWLSQGIQINGRNFNASRFINKPKPSFSLAKPPVTFQYNPNLPSEITYLHCGFPVSKGLSKVQKPANAKDLLSLRAKLEPVPLLEHELVIVEQWSMERKALLERWGREDISGLNRIMRENFNKSYNTLKDHLTPDDLAAIIKENRGILIKRKDGKFLNHVENEWYNSKQSFENSFNSPWLDPKPKNHEITEQQVMQINKRLGDISNVWTRFEKLMEQAKCLPETNSFKP